MTGELEMSRDKRKNGNIKTLTVNMKRERTHARHRCQKDRNLPCLRNHESKHFFLFPVEFSILLISSLFLFDQQSADSDMKEELENQF